MSIPTLYEAKKFPRVVFPQDNNILYSQDFGFWRGIPDHVVWYQTDAKFSKGQVELVAVGYGIKDSYGNGSLFVSLKDVEAARAAMPAKSEPV